MMIVLYPSTSHLLPSFPKPFSWTSSYLLSSPLLSFLSSLEEVQRELRSAGFSEVKSIGQLDGQTFCLDPHCGDVLVLPAQLKAQLCSSKLLSDHKLIIQVQAAHRAGKDFWQEQKSKSLLADFHIAVEVSSALSIFLDIYHITLVMDLLKLIIRLRSLMPTKISFPRYKYFTSLPLILHSEP